MTEEIKYYARPDSYHYHQRRNCPMLVGEQFEEMHYREIKWSTVKRRHLAPCSCATRWYLKQDIEQ